MNNSLLPQNSEIKALSSRIIDEFREDRHFMDYIYDKSHGDMNLQWVGKPMNRHYLTLWAIKKLNYPIHPYFVTALLILAGIFLIYGALEGPRIIDRIQFVASLVFIVILSPLTVKKIQHNTAYAVTDSGIFFKFYKGRKPEYHFMDFNDIRSFRVDKEKKYNPKVIIYPMTPIDFTTKDYITEEVNCFPTIENQKYADELANFLSELRIKRRMELIKEGSKRR